MTSDDPGGRTAPSPLVVPVDGTCPLPRESIGAKAWGVNRMRSLALPVPPAFVVTTDVCRAYFAEGARALDCVWDSVAAHVSALERESSRRFGHTERPLLVSVRSGAARSMPGMMDTILDLGINAAVETALGRESGDPSYAAETHLRFRTQFGRIVLHDRDDAVPEDPWLQLRLAIAAVFDSWNSPRARTYRRLRGLPDGDGTAVMVQAMVFGNLDAHSGTGVVFSRNPLSGDPAPWGEWLRRAQGEDVVSGTFTPASLDDLRDQLPAVHSDLLRHSGTLERDARDIQDIEYTVEAGRLWLLQCRVAKRSPRAAVRAAVAFVDEGLITPCEALRRLDPEQMRSLPLLALGPAAQDTPPLLKGEPASPGIASGIAVIDAKEAEERSRRGESVILVRPTTSPDDLHGVIAARALVTEQGGSTSHAAVVSRELGRPCIVGCGTGTIGVLQGRILTIDGATGRIWPGDLTRDGTDDASPDAADLRLLLQWARARAPIAAVVRNAAPPDCVDLDAAGTRWRDALRPGIAARGRVLDTDEGIHAAVEAGVTCVAVQSPLTALLAALQARAAPAPSHAGGPAQAQVAPEAHTEFALLRMAALKGRASAAILGEALALPTGAVREIYQPLCDAGLCAWVGDTLRVSEPGRERLRTLLAHEHETADAADASAVYEAFRTLDHELKAAMTAWQVRPDGQTNDHTQPDYDARIRRRIEALHARLTALAPRISALSPRLAEYPTRLDRAAARVAAGDRDAMARVIADSYHTVWFELHEDLLSVSGRSRRDLERAGP